MQLKKELDELIVGYNSPGKLNAFKPRRILESNLTTSLKIKTKRMWISTFFFLYLFSKKIYAFFFVFTKK